jgi:hypothetical protein
MMSARWGGGAAVASNHLNKSRSTTVLRAATPNDVMFFRSSVAADRSASKNVACAAPRLSDSSPMLPVPAKQSYTRDPSSRGASTSNSDCFTRSVIGRVVSCVGGKIRRLRNSPAMMRTSGLVHHRQRRAQSDDKDAKDRQQPDRGRVFRGHHEDLESGSQGREHEASEAAQYNDAEEIFVA